MDALGHVAERRLDEAVGRVAQEVAELARCSDGNSFGGGADLGGLGRLPVGGVQVEVGDVPEPAWRGGGGVLEDCVQRINATSRCPSLHFQFVCFCCFGAGEPQEQLPFLSEIPDPLELIKVFLFLMSFTF